MLTALKSFQKNVYSQNGEDGLIQEILTRISKKHALNKWCVEFGAWDGVYLSNTCRLIREEGYSAVLLEGDSQKIKQLEANFPQANVHKLCEFVSVDGEKTLENLLAKTPIPHDFDFLSVDIDGMDYYVLESFNAYKPKIICIEFNPTIPNILDFVQPRDFSIKQGSSASALVRLANSKGYALVEATQCNVLFVRQDLIDCVTDGRVHLQDVNLPGNHPQFIFAGFDGTILSNKTEIRLPWHSISVPMSQLQFLPEALRTYRLDYTSSQAEAFIKLLGIMPRVKTEPGV
ncbi:FkbM family methyltransferase [Limnohabitans sp. Jir72]|uniref:FkbM family methyltransferase n=1 Tax=Limnohabitans sp. Jir72 TaxID=1977909 RepID=UPI000D33AC11|nr:FkbM family methyltransferase [Limnohabitans sp. Jir72]PUE24589.1 hypothetical protein B9Z52_17020 [Limnohabitans sp. Jir72]